MKKYLIVYAGWNLIYPLWDSDICLKREMFSEIHKTNVTQLTPGCCYVLSKVKLANKNELVDPNSLL